MLLAVGIVPGSLSDYQGTVTNVVSMSNGSYTQLTYDPYGNVTGTSYFLVGRDCHYVRAMLRKWGSWASRAA